MESLTRYWNVMVVGKKAHMSTEGGRLCALNV
jgi:hypothetical protein